MKRFVQTRRDFLKLMGISGGAILWEGTNIPLAFAKEDYPAKRITWINPTKAGGGSDAIARLLTRYLQKHLKELNPTAKGFGGIAIKNDQTAGGQKAYHDMFFAKPDGYTIGDFNNAFMTESIFSSNLDFDYKKFTFIARSANKTTLVLARKDGFKSWDQMMKAGKTLKLGTTSYGRSGHISCIFLKETAKVPARIINHPGAAETVSALLRGDVDLIVTTNTATKALIDSGDFRVLLVLGDTSEYPGVPALPQIGHPQLTGPLGQHRLIIGPPNLPKEVTETLIAGFKKVFADKEFLTQAEKMDFEPNPLYGKDVEKVVKDLMKYYEEMTPLLKKHLDT